MLRVLHVLVPAKCAQEAMELGDASVETEARERSEGSDGARDVPRGAVAPDEEECEILRGGSRVGLEGGGAEIMLRGMLVFIVY